MPRHFADEFHGAPAQWTGGKSAASANKIIRGHLIAVRGKKWF
jgi:hypothetical protein